MTHPAAAQRDRAWAPQNPRDHLQRRHFPNVSLVTHEGRAVRFYDDVIKDRKVVISFFYTSCSNLCTPATRHLVEAREMLGSLKDQVSFYSISLTPLDDDPPALRKYMASFGIDQGWTFLTGRPRDIDQLRTGLGFGGDDPKDVADLDNHSGMVRIGDEARLRWGHASVLTSGRAIARMIRFELV